MTERKFNDGAVVKRIENCGNVRAIVVSAEWMMDEWIYALNYSEGGSGYWPESCLAKTTDQETTT